MAHSNSRAAPPRPRTVRRTGSAVGKRLFAAEDEQLTRVERRWAEGERKREGEEAAAAARARLLLTEAAREQELWDLSRELRGAKLLIEAARRNWCEARHQADLTNASAEWVSTAAAQAAREMALWDEQRKIEVEIAEVEAMLLSPSSSLSSSATPQPPTSPSPQSSPIRRAPPSRGRGATALSSPFQPSHMAAETNLSAATHGAVTMACKHPGCARAAASPSHAQMRQGTRTSLSASTRFEQSLRRERATPSRLQSLARARRSRSCTGRPPSLGRDTSTALASTSSMASTAQCRARNVLADALRQWRHANEQRRLSLALLSVAIVVSRRSDAGHSLRRWCKFCVGAATNRLLLVRAEWRARFILLGQTFRCLQVEAACVSAARAMSAARVAGTAAGAAAAAIALDRVGARSIIMPPKGKALSFVAPCRRERWGGERAHSCSCLTPTDRWRRSRLEQRSSRDGAVHTHPHSHSNTEGMPSLRSSTNLEAGVLVMLPPCPVVWAAPVLTKWRRQRQASCFVRWRCARRATLVQHERVRVAMDHWWQHACTDALRMWSGRSGLMDQEPPLLYVDMRICVWHRWQRLVAKFSMLRAAARHVRLQLERRRRAVALLIWQRNASSRLKVLGLGRQLQKQWARRWARVVIRVWRARALMRSTLRGSFRSAAKRKWRCGGCRWALQIWRERAKERSRRLRCATRISFTMKTRHANWAIERWAHAYVAHRLVILACRHWRARRLAEAWLLWASVVCANFCVAHLHLGASRHVTYAGFRRWASVGKHRRDTLVRLKAIAASATFARAALPQAALRCAWGRWTEVKGRWRLKPHVNARAVMVTRDARHRHLRESVHLWAALVVHNLQLGVVTSRAALAFRHSGLGVSLLRWREACALSTANAVASRSRQRREIASSMKRWRLVADAVEQMHAVNYKGFQILMRRVLRRWARTAAEVRHKNSRCKAISASWGHTWLRRSIRRWDDAASVRIKIHCACERGQAVLRRRRKCHAWRRLAVHANLECTKRLVGHSSQRHVLRKALSCLAANLAAQRRLHAARRALGRRGLRSAATRWHVQSRSLRMRHTALQHNHQLAWSRAMRIWDRQSREWANEAAVWALHAGCFEVSRRPSIHRRSILDARWRKTALKRGMGFWRTRSDAFRESDALRASASCRLAALGISRAFRGWHDFARECTGHRAMRAIAIGRWRAGVLQQAWRWWAIARGRRSARASLLQLAAKINSQNGLRGAMVRLKRQRERTIFLREVVAYRARSAAARTLQFWRWLRNVQAIKKDLDALAVWSAAHSARQAATRRWSARFSATRRSRLLDASCSARAVAVALNKWREVSGHVGLQRQAARAGMQAAVRWALRRWEKGIVTLRTSSRVEGVLKEAADYARIHRVVPRMWRIWSRLLDREEHSEMEAPEPLASLDEAFRRELFLFSELTEKWRNLERSMAADMESYDSPTTPSARREEAIIGGLVMDTESNGDLHLGDEALLDDDSYEPNEPRLPPLPWGPRLHIHCLPPAPTADEVCLGGKLWRAAPLLCRWLRDVAICVVGASVLELGAGTGACGLYAAALGARRLLLTEGGNDVSRLLPLLRANVRANASLIGSCKTHVAALHWGCDTSQLPSQKFDIVLGSDIAWGEEEAQTALCSTLAALLRSESPPLVVLAMERGPPIDLPLRSRVLQADGEDVPGCLAPGEAFIASDPAEARKIADEADYTLVSLLRVGAAAGLQIDRLRQAKDGALHGQGSLQSPQEPAMYEDVVESEDGLTYLLRVRLAHD